MKTKNTYGERLQCFLEEKAGQIQFNELKVHSNEYERFVCNGCGTVPAHLQGNNTIIDLKPRTSELKEFNLYLYGYLKRLIANPSSFYKLKEDIYEGFLANKAEPAFELQLSKALRKEDAIVIKKKEIERTFQLGHVLNYIDLLYPYEIKNQNEWQVALFNAFVNGYEYDFGRRRLSVEDVKALYHVEQVFEFYQALLNFEHSHNQKADINMQSNGIVLNEESLENIEDFINRLRSNGISTYHRINKELANDVLEYNKRVYNHSLSLTELQLLYRQLQQSIKLYKDRLNKTMEEIPDAATALSSFEVVKSNGEKYIVNEGLEEKIEKKLNATIESLGDAIEIVKEKIKHKEQKEKPRSKIEQTSTLTLSTLFKKPEYYDRCLEILNHFEAETLTSRKGYILFAIIDAMKDKSEIIFHKNYRDEDLLPAFNAHLNKNYRQLKRNSIDFKRVKIDVKQMLSNL